MTAYLSAAKKAAIKKQMRAPNKSDVEYLLNEVALAIAADAPGEDIAAALVTATTGPSGVLHAWLDTECAAAGIVDNAADALIAAAFTAHKAAVVTALAQDTSSTYVEAEVQAIATKVDAILTALKAANLMASA
jgi:hypothetical protein